MIAFGTMLNYLDRTVLGIAAPTLTKELGLTAAMMGIAFSAFSWSYALLQIPGGIALDRFGTTHLFRRAFFWSVTAAMGGVRSLRPRPHAHRRRDVRSSLLPSQQPDSGVVVPAERTHAN
jgi:MFS family permease